MKRALVTGGAGFIGSHVAEDLVRRNYEVTVLDNLTGGFVDNVVSEARFVQGSINDLSLVNDLFAEERYDYVFHLAAYAAEGLSHFIKRFNYTNNLLGSVNLLNASINVGVKCFVFTSSIAVYGACPELPMTEESPTEPEDPYGIAKLAVEQELKVCKKMFGLDYIIFRPHNVYGERQNIGDSYRNVVGIFMNRLLQNKPMPIFGDGNQTRAFTHIGDVAPIIARSVEVSEAYNQVFNVGADQACTVNDLALAVARAMDASPEILHLPERQEVLHAFASHEKVRRFFPGSGPIEIGRGLQLMAEWVKSHGARTGQPFHDIEVWRHFPEAWRQL